jgi:TolA-binding protein
MPLPLTPLGLQQQQQQQQRQRQRQQQQQFEVAQLDGADSRSGGGMHTTAAVIYSRGGEHQRASIAWNANANAKANAIANAIANANANANSNVNANTNANMIETALLSGTAILLALLAASNVRRQRQEKQRRLGGGAHWAIATTGAYGQSYHAIGRHEAAPFNSAVSEFHQDF